MNTTIIEDDYIPAAIPFRFVLAQENNGHTEIVDERGIVDMDTSRPFSFVDICVDAKAIFIGIAVRKDAGCL